MRIFLTLTLLLVFLSMSTPAQAQLRDTAISERAPAKLHSSNNSNSFSLNKLFDPSVFRMNQSIEFSSSSFGGNTSSLGMFTNSMMWQFSDKLAARVDVSAAYSPNAGSFSDASGNMNGSPQIFIRNAEVAYRPSENVQLHLSFRRSPYGMYASPYGYARGGYGYGASRFDASFFGTSDDLFWRDSAR